MSGSDPLVTIVIPLYNVEAWLPACLDSVRNQSFRNLQIILVDDGSTDGCPGVCDRAAREDSRIQVIHKANGGLSDARNVGIDAAAGEWITFVDSDDWISPVFVSCLLHAAWETNAEIAVGDYLRTSGEDFPGISSNHDKGDTFAYSGTGAVKACYRSERHGMSFTTWGKLYRTSLWKESGLRFPKGKIHEDAFTTYRALYSVSGVAYTDKVLYYYRQTEGSIMQKPFSLKRLDGLEAAEGAWKFFLEKGENELASLAGNYYCRLYFGIFYRLRRSGLYPEEKLGKFQSRMRADLEDCMKQCRLPFAKAAAYRFAAAHPSDPVLKKVMAE